MQDVLSLAILENWNTGCHWMRNTFRTFRYVIFYLTFMRQNLTAYRLSEIKEINFQFFITTIRAHRSWKIFYFKRNSFSWTYWQGKFMTVSVCKLLSREQWRRKKWLSTVCSFMRKSRIDIIRVIVTIKFVSSA